jgi:hypothetical protein
MEILRLHEVEAMRRREFLAGSAVGALGLATWRPVLGQEASNTAKQAFSFAYPLVLMDLTQKAMSGAGGDPAAGFNRFLHYPQFPTAQFTAMVCPVADALHSSAWLSVKQEPMVVSTPALGGRFCTGSFFHAWHDVLGRVGSGVNGGRATDYLVTGPGWAGTVPKGLVQIASPTNMVWAPVWISVKDATDLTEAAALQAQFRVTPLKDWKGSQPAGPGKLAAIFGSFFKKPGIGPAGPMDSAIMPAAATGRPPGIPVDQMPVSEGQTPPVNPATPPMPLPTASPDAGTPPPNPMPNPMPGAEAMPADGYPGGAAAANGGTGTSPNAQLFTMDANTFYTRFCQLMTDNPPLEADAAFVAKLAKLGMTPGATIDVAAQSRANQMAFLGGVRNAGQKIFTTRGGLKVVTGNRWETAVNAAEFGTNYDRRAHATLMYFGASDAKEVLCPRTSKDSTGKPLISTTRYTLTFASGQLPPVTHSWTLMAYKAPFMELVDNPLGRLALNSNSPLVKGPDGAVTIYVQKENPGGEKEANWLPSPDGVFELMLRLCGPKPEVAGLQWKPPAVTKA